MKSLSPLRCSLLFLLAVGLWCSPGRASLVIYYNFDNAASPWGDSSGNGNDAVPDGTHPAPVMTTSAAIGGGAVDFADSGATQANWLQNLQLPDIRSLFTGNAATISMWVKLVNVTPANGNQTGLFYERADGVTTSHYPWTDGLMYCAEFRNSRVDGINLTSQDRSQWHHLTLVADASPAPGQQVYKIFQNTTPVVDRSTDTFAFSMRSPIMLGVSYTPGGGGVNGTGWFSLNGLLDDVGVFNEALPDGKVLAIYNTPQAPGLADYGLGRMNQLFAVYDSPDPGATASIGILTWGKAAGLTRSAGDAWVDGANSYVQLDSSGNGLIGTAPNLRTWTGAGSNDNWSTGVNWDTGTPPTNGGSLVFAGSNRTTNINDNRLTSAGSIAFANGDFTLKGSDLALSDGIASNEGSNTVALNLSLLADQRFLCVAGALHISGNVNNGSSQLSIDGAGDTVLSGVVGDGAGRLVKSGTGTLTLSGVNTYQGGLMLNAGTLKISADAALGEASGGLVFAGGAALQADAPSVALDPARSVSIIAGTATFDTQANAISVPGPISGVGSLAKIGPGTLTLTGANTFNGEMRLKEGALDLGATGGIQNNAHLWIADTPGATAVLKLSGGSIATSRNVYLGYGGSGEITQTGGSVTLTNPPNSLRLGEGAGSSGTYNISSGSLTIDCPTSGDATIWIGLLGQGTMNISGDATVNVTGGAGAGLSARGMVVGMGGTGLVNQTGGAVTLNNAPLVLGRYWTNTTATGEYKISAGSLTTQGSVDVNAYVGTETGTFGTLEVSGDTTAVSIQGNTHVGYAGTGTLTISDGAYTTGTTSVATLAGSTGTLNLNGGTYTTTGLNAGPGAATVTFDGGTLNAAATFTSQAPMTFKAGGAKIDTNGQTVVLAGSLSGTGGLAKQGNGTLLLAGANSFGGALDVQSGLVKLVDPAPAPPVIVGVANASLRLWLDADDAATVQLPLNDGKIRQWNDKSSYANHAFQSDPARQGTYQTAWLNGKSIVDLGYPGQSIAMMFSLTSEISDIQSVFVVLKGGGPMLGHNDTGTPLGYEFHRGGPNWGASASDAIWAPLWASPNIQNGQTYLNGVQVNGTTTALPGAYSIIDVQTVGAVSANQIGEDRNLEGRSGQQIAEIIVFNAALAETDRQAIEYYLGNKWLLSAVSNLPPGIPVHVAAGAALDLSNQSVVIGPLSGETDPVAGPATVLLGNGTLTTSNTDPAVFAGHLTGSGGLVKDGTGMLTLSGQNDYTGGTTLVSGTLKIGSVTALPAGRSLTVGQGGTVVLASGLSAASSANGVNAVPESGTLALLAAAAATMLLAWRHRPRT